MEENRKALKKQKTIVTDLLIGKGQNYYSHLNLNNITDNKKFWNTMKPFFTDKGGSKDNIVLVEGDKIISDDIEVAQIFNDFFKNTVKIVVQLILDYLTDRWHRAKINSSFSTQAELFSSIYT